MLDLPMAESSGTQGRYCSGNVQVAGPILREMHAFLTGLKYPLTRPPE